MPSTVAGNRAARRLAILIWVPATVILCIAGLMILGDWRPLPLFWFDNVHWTVAYFSAAVLAWIGVRCASSLTRPTRWWFAIGLSANALGHVLWNFQESLKWSIFPAPSDVMFLAMGPAFALGFWTFLRSHIPRSELRLAALDTGALASALLATTLALYLPRQGEMSLLAMTVLVGYPAFLLSAACLGIILLLTLRLRGEWGSSLFLLALIGTGITWMHWNLLALTQSIDYGSWPNFGFSVATLGLGLGALCWEGHISTNPHWERFCDALLRLLPMLLVIAAATSVAFVWIFPSQAPGVQASIEIGAAGMIILAMVRQTMMLADRNRLLAAEYRLRESELKFRTLFEMAEDAVFILDGKNFLDCNLGTLSLFGCTKEEIMSLSAADLLPEFQPDGRLSTEKAIQFTKSALNGQPQAAEWRLRRVSDGSWFDAEVHANRIDLNGRPMLGAIVRDITDRKSSQEQVRIIAERLKLAIRAGKIGIWDLDLTSGKLVWDEQMFLIYGRTISSDGDPSYWYDSMHPDDVGQARAIQDEILRGERASFDTNFRIFRQHDGSLRYIRAMGSVVPDAANQPLRILGINWDVTEERSREAQLAQALEHEKELTQKARAGELAKSEFLAVMSHEIRTPMNGIMGFAELLSQSRSLPADCREFVETITTSSEALLRILDDVLVFSRLEANHVEIEKTAFSPREMLRDICTLLAPSASNKSLAFDLEIEPDAPEEFLGDAGRLRQVLLNLAGNAIKFTEHGSVVIGMRHPSDAHSSGSIEFFVRDTGAGIPKDKLAAIFQPFVQADYTISRRHGGAGLGLTISQRLTELMGGELRVQSEPGKGSLFSVLVPVVLAAPGSTPEAVMDNEKLDGNFAASHPLRILFAEDDAVNKRLISIVLSRLGYEPLVALNGREAVEIFRQQRPDFVLMDIQMPEMDGIEATRRIREIERASHSTPTFIVAHTANISPDEKRRCFDAGMDFYLNKPLRPTLLTQALKMPAQR